MSDCYYKYYSNGNMTKSVQFILDTFNSEHSFFDTESIVPPAKPLERKEIEPILFPALENYGFIVNKSGNEKFKKLSI